MENLIDQLNREFNRLTVEEGLQKILSLDLGNIAFSTSLGQEDQVITDLIFRHQLPVSIFTLDTGRLFEKTWEVYQKTIQKYHQPIQVFSPEAKKIEALVTQKGPFSFYDSIENRKECCQIRKVEPLQRALQNVSVWITGLRAEQSVNRKGIDLFSYDNAFGLIKYNPLARWTLEEVEAYLEKFKVPQNSLHSEGFKSIGCAPCTRATSPVEDIRAGRWWWETSKKECGLHLQNNNS